MPKASVKKKIECNKEQLIDLVLDIEKYPQFVPFCLGSKIYEKKDKDTYKSDVKFNKNEDTIYVTNLDGPLKHLENKWYFKEINNFTEVSFDVDFELKNHFLNIIMTKSFQFGLDKIADAFQKRAETLFSKT